MKESIAFIEAVDRYIIMPDYAYTFGAKVYKIARDDQGNRLTYMKLTGGSPAGKDGIDRRRKSESNQYLYRLEVMETVQEVEAGRICAVADRIRLFRKGLGIERSSSSDADTSAELSDRTAGGGCDAMQYASEVQTVGRRNRSSILPGRTK